MADADSTAARDSGQGTPEVKEGTNTNKREKFAKIQGTIAKVEENKEISKLEDNLDKVLDVCNKLPKKKEKEKRRRKAWTMRKRRKDLEHSQ